MTIFARSKGIAITLELGVDVSFGTTFQIHVQKPNGGRVVWAAILVNATQLQYVTLEGDLDKVGTYVLRGYVESATFRGWGDPVEFEVGATI